MNVDRVRIRLEPLAVVVEVPRGALLSSSLPQHGVEFPCGGSSLCGGCGVRVLVGSLPVTDQDRLASRVWDEGDAHFQPTSFRADGGSPARRNHGCRLC